MTNPNGRVPTEPPKPKAPPPPPPAKAPEQAKKAAPVEPDPQGAKSTPPVAPTTTPKVPDTLKSQMPTGEAGVRNPPGVTHSSDSGGTSKAEDTSRAAGYVADLTKPNAAPPGPPVAETPENFKNQTGTSPKPGTGPAKATPNTTPPKPSTPSPAPKTRPAPK